MESTKDPKKEVSKKSWDDWKAQLLRSPGAESSQVEVSSQALHLTVREGHGVPVKPF
jgi:hypothetical protein